MVQTPLTAITASRFCAALQSAARLVKETMDKKYNESWVVVIGQGFAFEVTHEVKHVLWMYFWNIAILVYKGTPPHFRWIPRCTPLH